MGKATGAHRRTRRMLLGSATVALVVGAAATSADAVTLSESDARFILDQIKVAETGAQSGTGPNQIADPTLPRGLRTVLGTGNNRANTTFGAADQQFPRLLTPVNRDAETVPVGFPGVGTPTTYAPGVSTSLTADSQPRVISNLIVEQGPTNAAAEAARGGVAGPANDPHLIPNVAPDAGLGAPYNSWFTLFGQFFDHGLDLVPKGGNGTVVIPLKDDDPLVVGPDGSLGTADDLPADKRFMVLSRAAGGAEHRNIDTPFIDLSQSYSSHPSHQVFLREYVRQGGVAVPTGRLLEGAGGGPPTWAEIKAQAQSVLGVTLTDQEVFNVPAIATNEYGAIIPNASGNAARTGGGVNHAFLDDIAHHAVPGTWDHDGNPATAKVNQTPDTLAGTADDGQPGTYDDELLNAHFVVGDGRANENIGLTAVHTVFHAEHNRVVDQLKALVNASTDAAFRAEWVNGAGQWNGERLFQAARVVSEMEYQHLVFEEFARRVSPNTHAFAGYDTTINPAIAAEFAHVVYRFGHSMLTEQVDRRTAGGGNNPIGLIQAFLNPVEFVASGTGRVNAAGNIAAGMVNQRGNELDEFVTGALRNNLVGLPLDLAALNIARGRDTRVPGLNDARGELTSANGANLPRYATWSDFGAALRHPESLVNFIAAYATESSVVSATTTAGKRAAAQALLSNPSFMNAPAATSGVDDIDFWIGGLAEKPAFGDMLGPTFNFVFQTQMEKLQDGDRFYYLHRLAGTNLVNELEAGSFAELIMTNLPNVTNLPGAVFDTPDLVLDAGNLPNPLPAGVTNTGGQLRYTGTRSVIMGGTAGANNMRSDRGLDTLWGKGGNDVLEGGDDTDVVSGGDGNDIVTDASGLADKLKGDNGNDIIRSGVGADLVLGGNGNDFMVSGPDGATSTGGQGVDYGLGGASADGISGSDGDDWLEGGGAADTLVGGNGQPFHLSREPGEDVLEGGAGPDALDGEGGSDILVNSADVDSNEGGFGFDFMTHVRDTAAATSDLTFNPVVQDPNNLRDTFFQVEGLSGTSLGDTLRGDNGTTATMGADQGIPDAATINKITGLSGLLPSGATSFTGGNILLGGAGPDLIEGRGGDDVIDGDAYLDVELSRNGTLFPNLAAFQANLTIAQLNGTQIVRSIKAAPGVGDAAVFSDAFANYDITRSGNTVTVAHARGTRIDGTDTVRNVEALIFADQTLQLTGTNSPPSGTVTISDTTPSEDQTLSATRAFTDIDGIPGPVEFEWQAQSNGNWVTVGTGASFTPGDNQVGLPLRVQARYTDGAGAAQLVTSAATGATENVNDSPTGALAISGLPPAVGKEMTVSPGSVTDVDGLQGASFSYQWQAGDGNVWANIAAGPKLTPNALHNGNMLRVVATFTDARGSRETVVSAPTAPVGGAPAPNVQEPPAPVAFAMTKLSITPGSQQVKVTFNVTVVSSVQVDFRTTSGRVLRRVVIKKTKPGWQTVTWNRKDTRGKRVGPGSYSVVVKASAGKSSKTIGKGVRLR